MKDVGTVHVDHDVGGLVASGVTVPGDMVTAVENLDMMPRFGQLTGDDRTGEAGACDNDTHLRDHPSPAMVPGATSSPNWWCQ